MHLQIADSRIKYNYDYKIDLSARCMRRLNLFQSTHFIENDAAARVGRNNNELVYFDDFIGGA